MNKAVASFDKDQTGPLASVSGDLFGWEKVPQPNRKKLSKTTIAQLAQFPADWPEIEYVPIDVAVPPAGAAPTDNFIANGVALLTPISRGHVTITSADTNDKPLINPNWLFEKADQEVAVQAFRRIREISQYSGVVVEEVNPGPKVQSDADVLNWIQENASLIYHASATCKPPLPAFAECEMRIDLGALQVPWAKLATPRRPLIQRPASSASKGCGWWMRVHSHSCPQGIRLLLFVSRAFLSPGLRRLLKFSAITIRKVIR